MAAPLFKPADLRHADDESLRDGTDQLRRVVERLEAQADYLDVWDRYLTVRERLRQHDHTNLLPEGG